MTIDNLMIFASETAKEAEGIAALGIDGKTFIVQLITWLIVFTVLVKFVFKPIVNVLQKRQDAIDEGLRLTTEMVAEKDQLEAEVEKTMKKARKEANEIISKTHEQAASMIKDAEEAAQTKVDNMITEARAKIEEETQRARRALEKEVINLVVDATEAVVHEKIDAKKDASLIERALKGRA